MTVRLLLWWLFTAGTTFAAGVAVKAFDLTIPQDTAATSARVLQVHKDDAVRLRVTSEIPGEVHLHAYRLDAKAAPGVPAELNFKAHATGRFRIEWHPAEGTATKGDHHGRPLAVLEVRPR